MSKTQVGILSMIPNVSAFLFAPLWNIVCDMYRIHFEAMIISLTVSAILIQSMNYIKSFTSMIVMNLMGSFFKSPLVSLLDSYTITTMPDKSLYGHMRLWGAISFGIFAFVGGSLTSRGSTEESSKDVFRPLFFIASGASIVSGLIIVYLVNRKIMIGGRIKKDEDGVELKSAEEDPNPDPTDNELPRETLVTALTRRRVLIFACVVFLSGVGAGVIDAFLFLRLKQLGGGGLVMGLARFITCAAEVPMFQLAGGLQAKFGTWRVLAVTQLAFVIRFTYYSLLRSPWWVLPCEVLHGLTFAVTWSVSCNFANEIAPRGKEATVQSVLEGVHFGLGSGLGGLLGGFVYDDFGAVMLFRGCAVMSAAACALALLTSLEELFSSTEQDSLRTGASPLPAD